MAVTANTDESDVAPPVATGPVWSEYSRTITVKAYKVADRGERIVTDTGVQDIGPDNYVVNVDGFLVIVDAESFEATYADSVVEDKTPAE